MMFKMSVQLPVGCFEHGCSTCPNQSLNELPESRQVVRLRAKLTGAAGAIKGVFGIKSEQDPAVAKLEALQVPMNTLYATAHNPASDTRITCRSVKTAVPYEAFRLVQHELLPPNAA